MPIKNNGICKPKFVIIALSFAKNPATVQPTTPNQ